MCYFHSLILISMCFVIPFNIVKKISKFQFENLWKIQKQHYVSTLSTLIYASSTIAFFHMSYWYEWHSYVANDNAIGLLGEERWCDRPNRGLITKFDTSSALPPLYLCFWNISITYDLRTLIIKYQRHII